MSQSMTKQVKRPFFPLFKFELYTPTIGREVPWFFDLAPGRLLSYEHSVE
jgi:hypothetical protein